LTTDRGPGRDRSPDAAAIPQWRRPIGAMAERLQAPARGRPLACRRCRSPPPGPQFTASGSPARFEQLAAGSARSRRRRTHHLPAGGPRDGLQADGRGGAGVVVPGPQAASSAFAPQTGHSGPLRAVARLPTKTAGDRPLKQAPPGLSGRARPGAGGGGPRLLQGGQVVEAAPADAGFEIGGAEASPWAAGPGAGPAGAWDRLQGAERRTAQPASSSGRARRAVAQAIHPSATGQLGRQLLVACGVGGISGAPAIFQPRFSPRQGSGAHWSLPSGRSQPRWHPGSQLGAGPVTVAAGWPNHLPLDGISGGPPTFHFSGVSGGVLVATASAFVHRLGSTNQRLQGLDWAAFFPAGSSTAEARRAGASPTFAATLAAAPARPHLPSISGEGRRRSAKPSAAANR